MVARVGGNGWERGGQRIRGWEESEGRVSYTEYGARDDCIEAVIRDDKPLEGNAYMFLLEGVEEKRGIAIRVVERWQ